MATLSKRNFTRGIFSPVVQSRRDVDAWTAGAKRLTNVFLLKHGGVRKRPGTLFVYKLPEDDDDVRLLPFTYSPGQSYVRRKANPGVVTAPYHGLATGDEVFLSGIEGMTELNGRTVTVTVTGTNTFSIGIDTTGYATFTSDDGIVRPTPPTPAPTPPPVPTPTPTPTPPATTPPGGGGGGGGFNPDVVIY